MSDLGLPENRPALAWVASIPADWTTPTERLLLVALALDSFDGRSCAPGRDALMTFCGIRHVRTFQRLRDSLTSATLDRPALIAADIVSGRHTRYRFAPDSNSLSGADSNSLSGNPDLSAVPDSNSLSGQSTTPTARPDAVPVSTTCQHDLSAVPDSNSLSHPSSPHPDPEGGMREESASAPPPDGGARTRTATVEPLVFDALEKRWQGKHQPVISKRSRNHLAALLDAGWTPAQIVAAVRTIGTSPHNPSLLLEKHLQRQVDDHEPQDYGTGVESNHSDGDWGHVQETSEPTCKHGTPLRLVDLDTGRGCTHCQRIGFRVPAQNDAPSKLDKQWEQWIDHAAKMGFDRHELRTDLEQLTTSFRNLVVPRKYQKSARLQVELPTTFVEWQGMKGGLSRVIVRYSKGTALGGPPDYADRGDASVYRCTVEETGEYTYTSDLSALASIEDFRGVLCDVIPREGGS